MPRIGRSDGVRTVPAAQPHIHAVRKRFSPETIAELVADYQTGLSTAVLMRRYHLGKGPVLRILDQAGVTRHPNSLSDEQLEEAAELYRQGWSLVRLSEHLDVAQTTVWRGLHRMGVAMRRRWER
jgi:hypothetical protein